MIGNDEKPTLLNEEFRIKRVANSDGDKRPIFECVVAVENYLSIIKKQ